MQILVLVGVIKEKSALTEMSVGCIPHTYNQILGWH